jgi:hypothetical protein
MSDLGQRQDTQGFYLDPLWAQLDPVVSCHFSYLSFVFRMCVQIVRIVRNQSGTSPGCPHGRRHLCVLALRLMSGGPWTLRHRIVPNQSE